MTNQIPKRTREKISNLRVSGLNAAEISRKLNIPYHRVYSLTHLADKGFKSRTDYENHRAIGRGYESFYDYRKYRFRQTREVYRNIGLGDLVRKKLDELEKNQSWLAEQLGVSKMTVSYVINNKSFPSFEVLRKTVRVLLTKKEDLENSVENNHYVKIADAENHAL